MGGTTADELNYSNGPTRICGQDELYAVDVVAGADGKKRLSTDDQPLTSGIEGAITVGTSAVEAKVGASRLSGRRLLLFIPTTGKIWYGFNSSVTTASGIPIFNNQPVILEAGDVGIWLIAEANVNVRVSESK